MALSVSTTTTGTTRPSLPPCLQPHFNVSLPYPSWFSKPKTTPLNLFSCYASSAKPQSRKRTNPNTTKKKKPNTPNTKNTHSSSSNSRSKGFGSNIDNENVNVDDYDDDNDGIEVVGSSISKTSERYQPLPLPKPPAGFVIDDQGRVLMASNKRIATIVDSTNNLPLECIIRRIFQSSNGDECMLLCPVDMPVQLLKSTNIEGWSAVSDEEVESILPTAAYALAKVHMHLVYSGFCYTARGGFCYTEDDIIEFRTDNGQDLDGLPTEGIEITCFSIDGSHYMIYTPSDPLLFVSVKDENGVLQIADDELLEDPAIISAIDEETEFNALVEEEAALLESLLGKE